MAATFKLPINGLRKSAEMVLVDFVDQPKSAVLALFQDISQQKLNIFHLTMQIRQGLWCASCCISTDVFVKVETLIKAHGLTAKVRDSVAMLTLFPHQSRLDLLGRVLSVFKSAELPLHGMGSSISSLVLVTDYRRLTQVVSALASVLDLPPNHGPVAVGLQVRQI